MIFQEGLNEVKNDIDLLQNANNTLKKVNEIMDNKITVVKHLNFNKNTP